MVPPSPPSLKITKPGHGTQPTYIYPRPIGVLDPPHLVPVPSAQFFLASWVLLLDLAKSCGEGGEGMDTFPVKAQRPRGPFGGPWEPPERIQGALGRPQQHPQPDQIPQVTPGDPKRTKGSPQSAPREPPTTPLTSIVGAFLWTHVVQHVPCVLQGAPGGGICEREAKVTPRPFVCMCFWLTCGAAAAGGAPNTPFGAPGMAQKPREPNERGIWVCWPTLLKQPPGEPSDPAPGTPRRARATPRDVERRTPSIATAFQGRPRDPQGASGN